MSAPAAREVMDRRLADLRKRRIHVDPQDILEVVASVMGSLHGDSSSLNTKLHAEIEALATYISTVKAEIAEIRAEKINDEYVPTASDELSAIVGATEQATNAIFEAVEKIEGLSREMAPDIADRVNTAVTSIYEACGFQDITGQRISKVVKALQSIEQMVQDLLVAFGQEERASGRAAKAPPPPAPVADGGKPDDKSLMNGPQLPSNANSQADIDALLASFD